MTYKNKINSLNANLAKRIQELEETLAFNNEFINNLSHEIRTPIHGISALAVGLVDNWDKLDNDLAYKLAVKIATNSQRLLSLVSNILDLAKTEHEDVVLKLQNVNINHLIEEMVEECKNLYLFDKNIIIKFDSIDNIDLIVDPYKFTQVLRNLLSNAIKVTHQGTITISLQADKDEARIVVSDEGVGIPQKELKTIFDVFTQSSRTKGKVVGVGLGLSISQKIVEAHGGKIWAENNETNDTNIGARFIFTIPVLDGTAHLAKPVIDTEPVASTSTEANILIIDDEEACLLAAEIISYNTNYKIFPYASPIAALKWLSQNPNVIDIVMVDMMIPEVSGIDFLHKIKSSPTIAHIPVVMQSGTSDESKIQEALANGAVDFMHKPYNQAGFIMVVEKNLKKVVA